MLSWTVPSWAPATTDREDASPAGGPLDLSAAFETQARLWNHLLDANRSLWALYAPWLPATAWNWSSALAPAQAMDEGTPPAKTVDGVADALESQTRLWNHLVDANRNFWSAFNRSMPGAPWLPSADDQPRAANDEPAPREGARRTRPAPPSRKKAPTRGR